MRVSGEGKHANTITQREGSEGRVWDSNCGRWDVAGVKRRGLGVVCGSLSLSLFLFLSSLHFLFPSVCVVLWGGFLFCMCVICLCACVCLGEGVRVCVCVCV